MAGERVAFAPAVHAELVRLCSGGAPLRPFALQLLLKHLRCHSLATPQRRTWVLSILQDVYEAVQPGEQAAGKALKPDGRDCDIADDDRLCLCF